MNDRFIRIDDLTYRYHPFLRDDDACFYLKVYTAHKGYTYSDANNLISNLKKNPAQPNKPGFHYKAVAIQKVALILRGLFTQAELNEITFIPVPPSKNRDHEEYDDRLYRILKSAFGMNADIRELVDQVDSTESDHSVKSGRRQSIIEIYNNYVIDEDLVDGVRDKILIFDDVLTTGAHFRAMKRKLSRRFPNCEIYGIFICRRETLDEIGEGAFADFDDNELL